MFGFPALNELVMIMLIIGLLSATGIWPMIIRGLRELRGDPIDDSYGQPGGGSGGGAVSRQEAEVMYKLLGVSPSSTWEEIERAYRRKAKVHHPDHGGDDDAMRALNEAYSVLKRLRGR